MRPLQLLLMSGAVALTMRHSGAAASAAAAAPQHHQASYGHPRAGAARDITRQSFNITDGGQDAAGAAVAGEVLLFAGGKGGASELADVSVYTPVRVVRMPAANSSGGRPGLWSAWLPACLAACLAACLPACLFLCRRRLREPVSAGLSTGRAVDPD
eukprot:COSAG06_NODE_3431_length_5356_cov_5.474796_5_plen_157_part_00